MEPVLETSRQRIRGPALEVLIKGPDRFLKDRPPAIPLDECIMKADSENRVIASGERLRKALVGVEEWRQTQDVFLQCWSGTIFGYIGPGLAFREGTEKISTLKISAIVYTEPESGIRWIFPVPNGYEDRMNSILLANHPDFTLEVDGHNRIIHATKIDMLKGFPQDTEGWYKGDPVYGMPYGEEICFSSKKARFMWRAPDKMVSAAVYSYAAHHFQDGRPSVTNGRGIYLDQPPSARCGMLVEAPERKEAA